MTRFSGELLLLDRDDINTDEIIPARYLTEIEKVALAPHLLEDLRLDGFAPQEHLAGKSAILTRSNFGCGSSREHAAWALEVNGIRLVIAVSFARIFRQNMYNCGMIAAELPEETIDRLFRDHGGRPIRVDTDPTGPTFTFSSDGWSERVPFSLSPFERDLIEAGGWLGYADQKY